MTLYYTTMKIQMNGGKNKMHGFAWVNEVLNRIEKSAPEEGVTKVHMIYIVRGALSHYPKDEIEFAFHTLKKGTICEDADLIFEDKPGIVRCLKCKYENEWHIYEKQCEKCNGPIEIISGQETELFKIEGM